MSGGRFVATHGDTCGSRKSPEYKTWESLKQRCLNPHCDNYHNYGGRGITVCDRWLGEDGYANFLADMGRKPTPEHSLDRYPDNNGNYERDNCRWATNIEQARNRRTNTLLAIDSTVKILTEWNEHFSVTKSAIYHWLKRNTTKTITDYADQRRAKLLTAFGRTQSISIWGREMGLAAGSLKRHLKLHPKETLEDYINFRSAKSALQEAA